MNQKMLKQWWEALEFLNDERGNFDLFNRYLYDRFKDVPMGFYSFVLYVKERLQAIKKSRKDKYSMAKKYLSIVSPLCERFGFFSEKFVLDDLAFQMTQPKEYKKIDTTMKAYEKKSKSIIDRIQRILKKLLAEKGYDATLKGRYKSRWSIQKKMKKKTAAAPLELKDIFAFRIIVNKDSSQSCFAIMNLLHDRFRPISARFKDYISVPKINGYQSLHTGLDGVIPELKIPIEVQIRTKAMDELAEEGFAAHWIYYVHNKRAKLPDEVDLGRSSDGMIYCFSFRGDLFRLKQGSTARDFAHHIHSDLVKQARGVVINGKVADLDDPLSEGDCVEILRREKI